MPTPGVDPARVARVVAALAVGERDSRTTLCAASANVVRVSGAGVVLMSQGRQLGSVCVSDAVTEAVEDAQYLLGEGPCVDAWRTKRPVLEPDLTGVGASRWPGFREEATAAGVRAAFGFPLLVESVCIGALNLYHDRVGDLTAEQVRDAETVAYVTARSVLAWQMTAGSGNVAWQLEQVPAHRAVVHQATGRVSIQVATSLDDALSLLRAYAFAEGLPIRDVATDVVAGDLRFD